MRATLAFAALAFGLAACAPEGEDNSDAPGLVPGYELAAAKASAETKTEPVIDLTVEQLVEDQTKGDIRLIDIRRDDEVAGGMIPGAEHIPMEQFDPAKVIADDDRPIVLYCRSGRRSRIVGEKLAALTGVPTSHLGGGIIAWREAGNEAVKPEQ